MRGGVPYLYKMIAEHITYPYKTTAVSLPGNCNITYIDEGSGERTLLFIHGLANYAMVWKKNIDYLKQYYRCIAIDLPGNGLSDKNEHVFSMAFFADAVNNFINELGLKNVCIVGHSMGGQIALTTMLRHPASANTLILCAPAGFEKFTTLDKTLYYTTLHMFDFISSEENSLRKTIETSFYRSHTQGESVVKELIALMRTYKPGYYRKMVEACIKSMIEEQVYDQLGKIDQHTMVLFGNRDALIPNKLLHHLTTEHMAKDAVKKMPHALLHMIPDCGHFIQWEKADEVNKNIIIFLEEATRG